MNSREKILQAIRKGKPDFQPLPDIIGFPAPKINLAETFAAVLSGIGGQVVRLDSLREVEKYIRQHYDLSRPIISLSAGVSVGNITPLPTDDPHQFADLYLVLLRSTLGVAENGSVWVDEVSLPLRVLPFITLNLAVVIRESELVATMHEAYRRLTTTNGYGVFIAGPSKTADIEQSLVIGAHGPKAMTVFLLKE
jgi:L-lactate dehydrogenase complex protein LldG